MMGPEMRGAWCAGTPAQAQEWLHIQGLLDPDLDSGRTVPRRKKGEHPTQRLSLGKGNLIQSMFGEQKSSAGTGGT